MVLLGCFVFRGFFHTTIDRVAVWVLVVLIGTVSLILFMYLFKRVSTDLARGGRTSRRIVQIKDRYATRRDRLLKRNQARARRRAAKRRKH
jgi:beta-lactamase regulating signal transducer with metallopeptidase domain